MLKRDIVFRGARICDGQFVNGSLVEVNGECDSNESVPHIVISYGPDTFDWFEVDPETVGQFTGVTDKNGTKIFEGDIVRHIDTTCHVVEVVNSEVYFDTEMLEFRFRYSNELFQRKFNNEFEVIGNIHDNKELLK